VAQLPVPGRRDGRRQGRLGERRLTDLAELRDGGELSLPELPQVVRGVLAALAGRGHEAALVGGSLRDTLLERPPLDWDVATSARPEQVAALFPRTTWENRFGTVTILGEALVEVTTYRSESGYSDRRRPDVVRWGSSLAEDLARRDFTFNAIAWVPEDIEAARGRLTDPHGGLEDLRDRLLRAVGDPRRRFAEDALRLVRAARFAARLDCRIDPATEAAITELAPTAAVVSGERVRQELVRMLRADEPPWTGARPSNALRLLERLGLLAVILPELAALRGVPQSKAIPGDALDHTLASVDAAPREPAEARLAALFHDLGKALTLAEGHFYGHEVVGADLARQSLRRLRFPTRQADAIVHVVRHHMFAYDPRWTDAAVRRFLRRVRPEHLELLFSLRRADNAASGVTEPAAGGLDELRERIARELSGGVLEPRDLAIDGHDLQRELGLEPGPLIGELLDRLLEAVLEEPELNDRERLIGLARAALEEG
jgi:tRNA nucleotidyltransferase (CCA-adding enzyme)